MARYFRRRKFCRFTAEGVQEIDYKDIATCPCCRTLIAISNRSRSINTTLRG